MMLKLTKLINQSPADDTLTLPFDVRQKSRFYARTDGGLEVGLFLPRGSLLRSGMTLTGDDGVNIGVKAAPEAVSVVQSQDSLLFARACYHLGNRHVPLQILGGELRYLGDHVLDRMLEVLGLQVRHEHLPFEPEAGAYHAHDH